MNLLIDDPEMEQNGAEESAVDIQPPLEAPQPPFGHGRTPLVEALIDWGKTIAIALVIALTLRATVVQAYVIPTESMVPTVMPGDRIFGVRIVYRFKDPESREIIAFRPPPAATDGEPSPSYLKRVIAVAGDTVEVRNGRVYLNGTAMAEPYIAATPDYEYGPVRVPDGMLFVLGDNRRNSKDSHRWGFLPRKNVQAKAVLRFWPLNRFGIVK